MQVTIDALEGYLAQQYCGRAGEQALFMKLVRGAFVMRRKTLVNNLMSAFALSREEASGCLERAQLPAQVRAEALTIGELARLSGEIAALRNQN